MAQTFPLKIVTMDGEIFSGEVESIVLRSIDGDIAIMAGHTEYCTAVGMGTARVKLADGSERTAACIGGMLSVVDGEAHLIPTTWEWSDDIDLARAKLAKERAEARLVDTEGLSKESRVREEARLRRALVRISSAERWGR